jgi:hypothetical protein
MSGVLTTEIWRLGFDDPKRIYKEWRNGVLK